jgi:hypothetical protein
LAENQTIKDLKITMYMSYPQPSATVDCPQENSTLKKLPIQYLNREIDLTRLPEEVASSEHATQGNHGLEELKCLRFHHLAETAAIADGLSRNTTIKIIFDWWTVRYLR